MKLKKNEFDRYEVEGYEFHCGDTMFLKAADGSGGWVPVQVEHNGKDYYAIVEAHGWKFSLSLKDGMEARKPTTEERGAWRREAERWWKEDQGRLERLRQQREEEPS